ncbi:MAG: phosphoadenosine phosphosulfate reductase [Lentisphaerae bacterium RIFOXYC12_FULL_60_16]|nr:MAG: phosphoadenosine phosphosulfate reductase [Lentisphaerae bacterium RIFOXYC12_FULL_60_16]OGV84907.1 MAG: phosphoadenosine phosphosulfate reductase [Lentisphaerae bacterium RIFOXYB12_FULL_60_10]
MTTENTDPAKEYQGDGSPQDVLRWALDRFHPRIAVATSLQDTVLIHMAASIRKDVRVFSIDTGRLPEETYACADAVRKTLGIRIEWYFPRHETVQKLETEEGLFSFKKSLEARRTCCFIRKVEPLHRALSGLDAWVTGQRKDENVTRNGLAMIERDSTHGNIVKINPLINWSSEDVHAYIEKHHLPYNRLIDRGYPSIGCACCTRPVEPGEDPRAGRWWWEQPEHKECGLHAGNWSI